MKRTYTVREVEAWRTRMHRQHMRELAETRLDYFERGRRIGRDEVLNNIRELLKIEPAPPADAQEK